MKAYFYQKGFLHSKVIVADDSVASIGAANLDIRSFEQNLEINALLYDADIARQLKAQFFTDLQNSVQLDLDKYRQRPRIDRVKESVFRVLSPVLKYKIRFKQNTRPSDALRYSSIASVVCHIKVIAMSKIKKIFKEKLLTARGIIILLAGLLAFYFKAPILGVLASAYLIFFFSKRVADIRYTRSFENFIMIFLIFSNFLGGDVGFYDTVPWWDEMLHFVYGLAFTLIGYRIIAIFFEKRGIEKDRFIVLGFSFCFAIAIASLWEIYEYAMDIWFGDYFEAHGITLMQADLGSGEGRIEDTMNDIILAVLSSAVMNLMLLGYLSRSWFKQLANYNFIRRSPKK